MPSDPSDPVRPLRSDSGLEQEVARFEEAWQQDDRPALEQHLAGVSDDTRRKLLIELVHVDLEYRLKAGEAARVEDYLARFPELSSDDRVVLELLGSEYELRRRGEPQLTLEEYSQRFPQHREALADHLSADRLAPRGQLLVRLNCPHCQNPIQVVDDESVDEVLCPSCGSSFRLDHDRTHSWKPEKLPRLGKFELLQAVGKGAFGTVYRAKDTELDRVVAVKIPRSGQLSSGEDEDRFLREARSVAQLRHPGIVPVYETGRTESFPYIVTEFVQGLTLADLLTARRFDAREAADLIASVAESLAYAHGRGIIHRDVKPSNVMLDESGKTHLMDFGLARRDAGEITVTAEGQILGTPAYMSPEQARGEGHKVDGRSDVYSSGVILYELLTGERPFRGNSRMLLHQVLNDEPRPPRTLNDRIPKDLETICLKALQKEPAKRYDSAGSFAADLRRFLNGVPILARPVGKIERGWRWVKRNPVIAGLTAAIVTAIVVGTTATVFYAVNARTAQKVAEQQRNRAERLLYSSLIVQSQTEWKESNFEEAWAALDACQWELRGWEHDYVYTNFTRGQMTLKGHTRAATSVAFSPDGKRIATGGYDNTVKVWDTMTAQEILTLEGHTGRVTSVAFSPDGTRIASASSDGTVKVWDKMTGQRIFTLKGHDGPVSGVAFSPDGTLIASASYDQTVRMWDTTSGRETNSLKGHTNNVSSVTFSPDGVRIASGSHDKTVKVWDTRTGKVTLTIEGHFGPVTSVAFSPDGTRIASASSVEEVHLWNAMTGRRETHWRPHISTGRTGGVTSVAFSPDGTRIACSNQEQTVKVWDAANCQITLILKGHARPVESVVHVPSLRPWEQVNGVSSIAFSPDGTRIASASSDGTVKVWDSTTNQETPTLKGHTSDITSVSFSPNGTRIASASSDGTVKVWDTMTGQEIFTLKGHSNGVESVAFSPDGARIASGGWDRTLRIWNAMTGQEIIAHKGHTNTVSSVTFSADGARIASGSWDRTLRIWNAMTGQEIIALKGHTDRVTSVSFSPDGTRIASASDDQMAKVWDTRTGQETLTFKGHRGPVKSVSFSPDGTHIVSSGSWDRTLKVWDAKTGQEATAFKGIIGAMSSGALSPDGTRIAGYDYLTLKVWDVTTGQETIKLKGHADSISSVAFSPIGKWIASGSTDGTIKVWDASRSMSRTSAE